MKTKKVLIALVILIVWAVFSVGYICYSQWQNFQTTKIQVALNQGYTAAVNDLYTAAKKCQPVPVKTQTETIQVVDLACLQQANKPAASASTPTPTATSSDSNK